VAHRGGGGGSLLASWRRKTRPRLRIFLSHARCCLYTMADLWGRLETPAAPTNTFVGVVPESSAPTNK